MGYSTYWYRVGIEISEKKFLEILKKYGSRKELCERFRMPSWGIGEIAYFSAGCRGFDFKIGGGNKVVALEIIESSHERFSKEEKKVLVKKLNLKPLLGSRDFVFAI